MIENEHYEKWKNKEIVVLDKVRDRYVKGVVAGYNKYIPEMLIFRLNENCGILGFDYISNNEVVKNHFEGDMYQYFIVHEISGERQKKPAKIRKVQGVPFPDVIPDNLFN